MSEKAAKPPSAEEQTRREEWFNWYTSQLGQNAVVRPAGDQAHACPCCGYLTLAERGSYEICSVCFWEDDGQDDPYADQIWGGPNGGLSLVQARLNFDRYGACTAQDIYNVRPPRLEEIPADYSARPLPSGAEVKRRKKRFP